jgi:hemoglobin-like flavoprotein
MLGLNWTDEIAAAWTAAYGMLSDHMIAEAYGAQGPAG